MFNIIALFLAATIYLPLLTAVPPAVLSADLRIDTIPLSQLYHQLATFGIPEPVRSKIIREETERRKQPVAPDQPAAPVVSTDEIIAVNPAWELLWIPTFCAQGQGCAFVWKCAGGCSSHWMIEAEGALPFATGWTPLLACPALSFCTVLSRIPAMPNVDVVAFQPYAVVATPIPISWDCI